jgi:hypothetical protein
MRRLGLTLAGFTLASAFYLLLVDTTSLPELYVLVAVALIATVAFEAAREHGFPEARFSLCTPARSATTSPGGPPGQACSGRCACLPSLE